jgi:hypothetical protein
MGTNFYWREVPKEFKKYKANVENYVGDCDDTGNVLIHIGKRSAAGLYCYECGITLNKFGTDHLHDCNFSEWYEVCPICGRKGTPICSFRWTMLRQKWLIEKLANEGCRQYLIVDENDEEYTPLEFLQAVYTSIEYQSCCSFN